MRMPFGQHRGAELGALPDAYLGWLATINLREPLRSAVFGELERRAGGAVTITLPRAWAPVISEIVEAGYRACARRHHPDVGGSAERMQQLNAAIELLRGGRA